MADLQHLPQPDGGHRHAQHHGPAHRLSVPPQLHQMPSLRTIFDIVLYWFASYGNTDAMLRCASLSLPLPEGLAVMVYVAILF